MGIRCSVQKMVDKPGPMKLPIKWISAVKSIQTIGGTNGGVYVNTNVSCYYKNNTDDFVLDNINYSL